ncbi:MAG: nuclear transport factor 2 family protein [Planctomycetota bacterium]
MSTLFSTIIGPRVCVFYLLVFACGILASCNTLDLETPLLVPAPAEVKAIDAVLDDFHNAAAKADADRYFGHFAPEGVFMGTDPEERWTLETFRAWASPYFEGDSAWVFTPRDRNVYVAGNSTVAWFDEVADSESYGACRGTGALRKIAGEWKIALYNLTLPIPNDLTKAVVARIRAGENAKATQVIVVRHAEKVADAGNPDPPLSEAGQKRAIALAQVLARIEISAAYATQFRRTQETVAPCAANNKIEPVIIKAGHSEELAEQVRTTHAGKTVLVSGHSNTVPALLTALGLEHGIVIRDSEYSDLFVVTLSPGSAPSLLHLRYGDM